MRTGTPHNQHGSLSAVRECIYHITHLHTPAKIGILGDWLRRLWTRCWRWSSGRWCYLWWRGRWCLFCGIQWQCGGRCLHCCMNCMSLLYHYYGVYTYVYILIKWIERCGLPRPDRERCSSGSAWNSGWGCWTGTVTNQTYRIMHYGILIPIFNTEYSVFILSTLYCVQSTIATPAPWFLLLCYIEASLAGSRNGMPISGPRLVGLRRTMGVIGCMVIVETIVLCNKEWYTI